MRGSEFGPRLSKFTQLLIFITQRRGSDDGSIRRLNLARIPNLFSSHPPIPIENISIWFSISVGEFHGSVETMSSQWYVIWLLWWKRLVFPPVIKNFTIVIRKIQSSFSLRASGLHSQILLVLWPSCLRPKRLSQREAGLLRQNLQNFWRLDS